MLLVRAVERCEWGRRMHLLTVQSLLLYGRRSCAQLHIKLYRCQDFDPLKNSGGETAARDSGELRADVNLGNHRTRRFTACHFDTLDDTARAT